MLSVSDTPTAPDPQLAFRSTVRDLAVTLADLSLSLESLAAAAANPNAAAQDPSGASPAARLAYATAEMRRLADAAYGLAVALLVAADYAALLAVPAEEA